MRDSKCRGLVRFFLVLKQSRTFLFSKSTWALVSGEIRTWNQVQYLV